MTNINNLPQELHQHKAFLVWKFKKYDKKLKPLKVPHYTNGKWRKGANGNEADRQQLTSLDKAHRIAQNGYEGVGMAMLADWGLVAVDFDDCVIDGVLAPRVAKLVEPTYWEFSPSREGVRAFFKGTLRDGKSNSKSAKEADGRTWGVEFFCSKGFVTLTGDVSEEVELTGTDIAPLTSEIKEFHSKNIGNVNVNANNSDQPRQGATLSEIKMVLAETDKSGKLKWHPDGDDGIGNYEEWLNVGMAIHHETDGEGFDVWNDWSMQSKDYSYDECQYKWESFGRGHIKSFKTMQWMVNTKGIDTPFENDCSEGFEPIAPTLNEKGKEVDKPLPIIGKYINEKDQTLRPAMEQIVAWVERPDVIGWEFAYDSFSDEVMWQPYNAEPPQWAAMTDEDMTDVRVALDRANFKGASKGDVRDAVFRVAYNNTIDTAQIWLDGLEWDGVPRIKHFFARYFGTDDNEYTQEVSIYLWQALAARVLYPGYKADIMPILVGSQRKGKTEAIEAIAPHEDHFVELSFAHKDDDASRLMRGALVAEVAELRGMGTKDLEAIKAFITRRFETWTPKYKEKKIRYYRRLVMIGTGNRTDFLSDPTGNRRFAPMTVRTGSDKKAIIRDRDQLWAEGAEWFKLLGEINTDRLVELSEEVNKGFMRDNPYEDSIRDTLNEQENEEGVLWADLPYIKVDWLFNYTPALQKCRINDQRTADDVRMAMRACGFEYKRDWHEGKRFRAFWKVA